MSIKGRRVVVTDGNVEKALRKFKKKITEQNLLQELRDREQFVKPSIVTIIDLKRFSFMYLLSLTCCELG